MKKALILLITILFIPMCVNAETHYLYDVLKNEAESNGLAKEYTGEHHDSFTKEPTKKIYHWYVENELESNQANEKNNVIFGDFCWKIVRTTDTGGVKLIYNGIPNNGICNNTEEGQQIGKTSFNSESNSPAYVGYMYNTKYIVNDKGSINLRIFDPKPASISYWYADSVTWNPTTDKWELNNPYQVSSESDFPSLIGKYYFASSSQTYTSEKVYYIANSSNDYFHCIEMTNGNGLSYYNDSFTYGDSYIDNNNGTYTIENPTTIQTLDYSSNKDNMKKKFICKNAVNNTCSELWFSSSAAPTYFTYYSSNNSYVFANNFTYNESTETYTLNNDRVEFWNTLNDTNRTSLNNHHYTCWNTTGECSSLSYVYYADNIYGRLHYINLLNGKNIETALNEMLYDENVNHTNSTIKTYVDNWFENNLVDYTNYIEDTIFCNNRSQRDDNNGWKADGGNVTNLLQFSGNSNSSNGLKCINNQDQFSTSNDNAKLTYPVGLLTINELQIQSHLLTRTEEPYWTITPNYINNTNVNTYYIPNTGGIGGAPSSFNYGVRPAISLKPRIRYISGNGSKNEPYLVDLTEYYGIDVEIKNETEDLTVEIEDLSQVEEGEEVQFKVTPIKGHKVTSIRIIDENNNEVEYTTTDNKNFLFTMPSSDVTIIPSYERVKNAVNVEDNKNTKEFVIEVNDSKAVVYEDTVRFRVEPEEGYEVESIDITDEEQNKISYRKTNTKNEYEFTMPDTDVLIKPKYRLIPTNNSSIPNPNTGRVYLLIILVLTIIGVITYRYKKKRLN